MSAQRHDASGAPAASRSVPAPCAAIREGTRNSTTSATRPLTRACLASAGGILIADQIVARSALQGLRVYFGHTAEVAAALIDGDEFGQCTRKDRDTTDE
jgi:hypothetical protein